MDRGQPALLVAADQAGNVFFVERDANTVRRLAPDGKITTVAGNGVQGFSGDGGPAVFASLDPMVALVADATGNFFIADTAGRVRRVTTAGTISTVAGNGTVGIGADGVQATSTPLCPAGSLAVDRSGNLFIATGAVSAAADSIPVGDRRIRKVSSSGIITTVAGNGQPPNGATIADGLAATSGPLYAQTIAVDAAGNVYLTDLGKLRKINAAGIITTVAAQVYATSMAIDASENVFFAQSTVRVRKMTSAGAITTVAGTQTVESGLGGENVRAAESPVSLLSPGGSPGSPSGSQVAIDGAGNVFFAELENRNGTVTRRIRKVNTAGIVSTIFSNQSPAPATARPEPLPAFRNGGTPAAPSGNFGARAGLGGATTVAPAAPAVAPSGRPTLLETRLGMIPHDPLITVKDCGHAANASMQPVVGACVDEAVRAKAPFIASFDQPGNAPQTVLGLGGTAPDGVVQVQFEGNGGAGGQRVSAGRDCHEPKIETAAGRVQVTCK